MKSQATASALPAPSQPRGKTMTIGELLSQLKEDFPAVTASKIRFLEEKGLITPQRTAAGYRKYTNADADRLRFILAIQRDEHKPLSVIKDYLDALDRGEKPQPLSSGLALGPREVTEQLAHEIIGRIRPLTRAELQGVTNASDELLQNLHDYSLLRSTPDHRYDEHAQRIVKAAVILASHGIDPRHLRSFKMTADRELGLVERAVAPMAARKDAAARARVAETAREISEACLSIHAALVQAAISEYE